MTQTTTPQTTTPQAAVPRLAVGEVAPSFQLPDQYGKQRSLEDLAADGMVALVFFRSADW